MDRKYAAARSDDDFSRFDRQGMIGFESSDRNRRRLLAMARGEYRRAPDEPLIWLESRAQLDRILANPNHPRRDIYADAADQQPRQETSK